MTNKIIIRKYLYKYRGGFVVNYIHKIARIRTVEQNNVRLIRAFFPPLPLPLTELIDYLSIHSSRPMINHRKSIFFLSSAFVHFPLYIDLLAVGARLTPYSLLLRLSAVLFVQRDYFNMGRCHARATANNLQLLPVFCN